MNKIPEIIFPEQKAYNSQNIIGKKAYLLSKLPSQWIPPYFVVSISAYQRWLFLSVHEIENWKKEFKDSLNKAVNRFNQTTAELMIVRSSCKDETMQNRGSFESKTSNNNIDDLFDTIIYLWEGCASSNIDMALIIQTYVPPKALGHLSNERRVSKTKDSWYVELEYKSATTTVDNNKFIFAQTAKIKFNNQNTKRLFCNTRKNFEQQLKTVASFGLGIKQRCHFEVVWGAKCLWVVQIDLEDELSGVIPGEECLPVPKIVDGLMLICPEPKSQGPWQKINSIRRFRECNLPHGCLYVLEDPKAILDLVDGYIPSSLANDLDLLTEYPIIIRMDLSYESSHNKYLLPMSKPLTDAADAAKFLIDVSKRFLAKNVKASEICFIFHRFIPARSGVFALAKPSTNIVQIDSTWGSPDSLNFYPHDTFIVDADTMEIKESTIRCKSRFIYTDSTGEWIEHNTKIPYDWDASLTETEIKKIAGFVHRYAQYHKTVAHMMIFAGISTETGYESCLPWIIPKDFYVEGSETNSPQLFFTGKRISIKSIEDIEKLQAEVDDSKRSGRITADIRPIGNLLRNNDFLKSLAEVSKSKGVLIEMEGSILSHAYYVLRKFGAFVRCIDPPKFEDVNSQQFNKLVRDKIPQIIEKNGERPIVQRVNKTQLLKLLKSKAVEEALELNSEIEPKGIQAEMADLLEVIHSLCVACDISIETLNSIALQKKQDRGGFDEGLLLVGTTSEPLIRTRRSDGAILEHTSQLNPDNPLHYKNLIPTPISLPREIIRINVLDSLEASVALTSLINQLEVRYNIRIGNTNADMSIKYKGKHIYISLTPLNNPIASPQNQLSMDF